MFKNVNLHFPDYVSYILVFESIVRIQYWMRVQMPPHWHYDYSVLPEIVAWIAAVGPNIRHLSRILPVYN